MNDPLNSASYELASRIYIELSSRVVLAPAQADKAKPTPDALARMSFKLADSFILAARERSVEPVAKKYEVSLSDVGGI